MKHKPKPNSKWIKKNPLGIVTVIAGKIRYGIYPSTEHWLWVEYTAMYPDGEIKSMACNLSVWSKYNKLYET